MKLEKDGVESKGIFVASGSRAATTKVSRASFPLHPATSVCNNLQGGMGLGRNNQLGD